MSYRLFPLTWEVARQSGSLAWEVADRIASFCEDMQTDNQGPAMANEMLSGLMQANPNCVVWVGMDGSEVVLHMLASIREGDGKRWIEISQYRKNGDFPEDMLREGFRHMEEWGKAAWGCTEVRLATLCHGSKGRINSPRGRLFESGYGFRPHRLVMVKEIEV